MVPYRAIHAIATEGGYIALTLASQPDGTDLLAIHLDDYGTAITEPTVLGTRPLVAEGADIIRLDRGTFLAVWSGWLETRARLLDVTGQPIAGEFVLRGPEDTRQEFQELVPTEGGFLMTWLCIRSLADICAQRYGRDLLPRGQDFAPLNRYQLDNQQGVAAVPNGQAPLLVWWSESWPGSAERAIVGSFLPLFRDDFENGDTASWSSSSP